ncbi:uncharacterized protein LOC113846098 isoform X2 [Abrus precatorius]|uniref:Uncharacterized protein LOC113846098 isoform X2 n=1 Tax=Abrus precatorius TaxID=3816 RepID=A0A8B8JEB1_ABRPR|nr:uncharacterized protein LOC113846098 isoform X2 [Abrus precatorius]
MDRQWRPIQVQSNVCPICSLSHFPFCPPPPYAYYPDHFPYAPANPNFPPYPQPPHTNADRTFKRPRIDDNPNPNNFSDDQRRLKLIRDHGVALPHSYVRPVPQHVNQNGFRSDSFTSHPLQRVPDGNYHNAPYHEHISGVGVPPQPPHEHGINARVVHHHPYPYATTCGSNSFSESMGFFRAQPPLPSSPPPPLPMDPSITVNHSSHSKTYFSPPKKPPSLFPVPVSSSPSSFSQVPEPHPLPQPYFHTKPLPEYSTGFPSEEPPKQYLGDAQPFPLNQLSADRPKFIDASQLFRHPHRASRPDHFVIIFRGLPGSGKSYLAKMLRDLEVENGCDAPRIHSMDDYFMTEVEKVEDSEASKSSSSGRNKKPVTKKVMEYCYEPEMEEAYRSSMLKAFKKTVEEGVFTFIIVDDRNLRVADFAQFWATAKRSGYEVYILEATYKDPAGCAARNVHGFTQEDIEKMSKQWEEAPSLYLQLDVKSLFHGDDLKESRIQEVDMDMEDDLDDALPLVHRREAEKIVDPPVGEDANFLKDGKSWDAEGEHPTEVRELGKSKWSEDFGEEDIDQTEGMKGNINALSGLIHQYGKERKSVHWGDQVGNTGFSIGAARKVNALSLVIGPGAGYNLETTTDWWT